MNLPYSGVSDIEEEEEEEEALPNWEENCGWSDNDEDADE